MSVVKKKTEAKWIITHRWLIPTFQKPFKLNIPLFKGFANEEIEVEIYADVDGRDVSLSLVSAGANEAIEEYKNKVIDEQLDAIRQIAPDIVIVEV